MTLGLGNISRGSNAIKLPAAALPFIGGKNTGTPGEAITTFR